MSAALALQRAIRARLIASPAVTALVPAAAVFDRSQRPEADACIILGETDQTEDGDMHFARVRIAHTIHIWRRAESLEGVAEIVAAARSAILAAAFDLDDPHRSCGHWIASARTMRDPGGEFAHAVMTVGALVEEDA